MSELIKIAKENSFDYCIKLAYSQDSVFELCKKKGIPSIISYDLRQFEYNGEFPFSDE